MEQTINELRLKYFSKIEALKISLQNTKEQILKRKIYDKIRIFSIILDILKIPDNQQLLKTLEVHIRNSQINELRIELKSLQNKLTKILIPEENYVGITDLSDPSVNLTWISRLRPILNIIATKNLKPIIPIILENKHRIILHVTCTGFGKTKLEPFAASAQEQLTATKNLIALGFPVEQIVLRLDPIILEDIATKAADYVLEFFGTLGIKRCRYSFLDQYPKIKENFAKNGIQLSHKNAISYSRNEMNDFADYLDDKWGTVYQFESCCEITKHQLGCISNKDTEIMYKNRLKNGADMTKLINLKLIGCKSSRMNCTCPLNKFELIKGVPGACPIKCVYCYWHSINKNNHTW